MVEFSFRNIIVPAVASVYIARWFLKGSSAPGESEVVESSAPFGSGKMFDKFAQYYDIGNRFMSLGQDQKWRDGLLAAAEVSENDTLLDLATGSADVAIAAKSKFHAKEVIGLDPSVEMLKVGNRKIESLGLENIELIEGDAQDMPQFTKGQFDKITMSFGIRNVPDRLKALKEMRRVISNKPTSRLAIMEFSAPSTDTYLGRAAQLFVRHVVPFIGGLITNATEEYRYLEESIFKFPSPEEFEALIEQAGFEVTNRTSYAVGVVNIYVAKPKH